MISFDQDSKNGLNAGVGEQILHGAAGKLGQRRGLRRGGERAGNDKYLHVGAFLYIGPS